MRAISLWRPWASLCVLNHDGVAAKIFETRHWYTGYRGPLLIHAAKKCDREILIAINALAPHLIPFGLHGPAQLPFGVIIGRVDLIGCCQMRNVPAPTEKERAVGNWSPDRYAWELANPVAFDLPIAYRGAQGFFDVPDLILRANGAAQ